MQMSIQFRTGGILRLGHGSKMEGVMTIIAQRKKLVIITAVIILSFCTLTQIALSLTRRPIPSREELCQALAGHIEWSECILQPTVTEVLLKAFPPGVTSREEVHSALGQYISYSTSNSTYVHYQLSSSWMVRNLGFQEIEHVFIYDQEGKLIEISARD